MTTETWYKKRRAVLDRDGNQCQNCGSGEGLLEIHHQTPVEEGGSDNLENLRTLCRRCHDESHGKTISEKNLGQTDHKILELLDDGREMTGSLADALEKHPQTIRDRLKWLREWGYVRYRHESTGLHELRDDESSD